MNGNRRRCRFRNGCWADPEDPADLADPEDLVGLVAQVVLEALAAAAEAPGAGEARGHGCSICCGRRHHSRETVC